MEKHPQLKEKLQLLYSLKLNPRITSNTDLAKEIGKSKQAISRWCIGSETTRGDTIPKDAIPRVAAALFVEPAWFSLSYPEFEEKVIDRAGLNVDPSDPLDVEISVSTLPITNVDIFGREEELELLDKCWFDSGTNVVEVVAFGGAGKSSLINAWLSKLSKSNYKGATKIYAWSFYWQRTSYDVRSSGDYFIEQALEWFGDENPTQGSPWSKANRLAKLIRKSRTLLILDGLETLQHSPGEKHGQVTNLALSVLVKELASENSGLCLITSRFAVRDLSAYLDSRVSRVELRRIPATAAIQMLKSAGLHGTEIQFQNAVETYQGHALCLSLLSGYLKIVYDGDLRYLNFMQSVFKEQHHKTHVEQIMHDYLNWLQDGIGLQVLNLVSLFDRSISLSQLKDLTRQEKIEGVSDQLHSIDEDSLRYAVKELSDTNLITLEEFDSDLVLDCHPLVKDFVISKLRSSDLKLYEAGHSIIFDVLIDKSPLTSESKDNIELLFRAVTHASKAKRYTDAFVVYHQRIKQGQFLLFPKGSHHADLSCLSGFFDSDWVFVTNDLGEEAQAYLLISAATNQINLGNMDSAISLSRRSIDWFLKNEKWLEASVAAAPLMSMLIAAGQLNDAHYLMKEMELPISNTDNEILKACAENFGAYISFLEGDIASAKDKFAASEKVIRKSEQVRPFPFLRLARITASFC